MDLLKVAAALLAPLAFLVPPACAAEAADEKAPPASAEADAGEKAVAEDSSISITLDELGAMLESGRTPRVTLRTKYTTLTGVAQRIEKRQVFIDVTGEKVAVAGVLGVPVSFVESVEVLPQLSDEDRRRIREESTQYLRKIAAAKEAGAPEQPTAEDAGVTPAPAEGEEAAGREAEPAAPPDGDLLEKYPPSEGWGPEKVFEITRKRIVLGLNPFGKEKTFLEDYKEWKKAYDAKRSQQMEQMEEYEAEGKKPPEGFEVWPELGPIPSLEGEPWREAE